jgi:hypothetical protein
MDNVLRCDCGFEVRAGHEADLVDRVQRHAWEAHGMELTSEQVLTLAFHVELSECVSLSRLEAGTAGDVSEADRHRKEEER